MVGSGPVGATGPSLDEIRMRWVPSDRRRRRFRAQNPRHNPNYDPGPQRRGWVGKDKVPESTTPAHRMSERPDNSAGTTPFPHNFTVAYSRPRWEVPVLPSTRFSPSVHGPGTVRRGRAPVTPPVGGSHLSLRGERKKRPS